MRWISLSSFNSLQTGKCIQRVLAAILVLVAVGFQFPSNGKVYSEDYNKARSEVGELVSIPFKRESVFRAVTDEFLTNNAGEFQFPSNGKVYSEYIREKDLKVGDRVYVSIPFKRESVFRDMGRVIGTGGQTIKFQFPSNGKVYSEATIDQEFEGSLYCFNSLQTGKCIQSAPSNPPTAPTNSQVSIPFKRESVFREI